MSIYDIQSFDPELGTVLLEFQALVNRNKLLESVYVENSSSKHELCYHNTNIEDLCLDFTLPGYPDYLLTSSQDNSMVMPIFTVIMGFSFCMVALNNKTYILTFSPGKYKKFGGLRLSCCRCYFIFWNFKTNRSI